MTRVPNMDREVASKSDAAVERETMLKWAGRAIACYRRYARTGRQSWLLRANDYRHEALEHAALVGDGGATVARIQREIDAYKANGKRKRGRKSRRRAKRRSR